MATTTPPVSHGGSGLYKWWAALAVVLILVAGVLALALSANYHANKALTRQASQAAAAKVQAKCVSDWANAFAARAQRLTDATTPKNDKFDALVRTIPLHSQSKFLAALKAYLAASDAYNAAIASHPLPAAPVFRCSGRAPAAASVPIVTRTVAAPKAAPVKPRIVTRTRVVYRTIWRTRTVPVYRTHTVYRTVYRTRTVYVCRRPNGRSC